MRLLELELENWGRHEKLKIDLSGSLQIGGRNGTGKSSILEAVRFIFSESGRGYNGKVRKGAPNARVKLRLQKDGDVYSIEKRIYAKRQPSTAMMWVNRDPVADNPSSVYKRLTEFISEDLIDNLVYVRQGSLTEIINRLRMKGGRQELDRLFGLDKLENVYKAIGEELRIKEAEHALIDQQLSRYPKDASFAYEKEEKTLDSEAKALEKRLESERKELHIQDQKIAATEKRITDLRSAKKLREDLEKQISSLRIEEAGLARDIESLKKSISRLSEKKQEAEALESEAKSLAKYPAIRDLLARLLADEEKLVSLGDLDAKKKRLSDLEKELNGKYNIEMEHESSNRKIQELGNKTAVLRQRITEKKAFLSELSSLQGKASCPKCGQPLSSGHLTGERKAAEEECAKLEKENRDQSYLLMTEKNKIAPLEASLSRMRGLDAELKQARVEYEKAAKEHFALQKALAQAKTGLKDAGYGNETMKVVDERVKQLQNIEGTLASLRKDAAREKDEAGILSSKEKEHKEVLERKKVLESEIMQSPFDEKVLSDLERRRDEIKDQRNRLSLENERMIMRVSESQKRIAELREQRKTLSQTEEKEKRLSAEISLIREARDVFHTDKGMVKYLREKYIKQLGMVLTQNFRKINENPRYRDIVFDKDYDLEIRSTDGSFSVDQLSGGEIVQLAIALRLSLLELLSPLRLLMLDEPFGSLDKGHREALGEALNRIANEGQLIIVTHLPVDSLQLPQLELSGY